MNGSTTVSDFVRNLRMEKGMSLRELSNRSGVGRTTIHDVENNKATPKANTLLNLLKVLRTN